MKIIYIAPQPIPSQAANSIHVMKMMQAFGLQGHDATLYFQRSSDKTKNIYEIYGVNPAFKMTAKINWPNKLNGFLYPLQCALSVIAARPDLVLSRNLLAAWLTSLCGLQTFLEIHDSPEAYRPAAQKIFITLTKRKNTRFIVISKTLFNHLTDDFLIPAKKIILAPDAADPLPHNIETPFEKAPGNFHAGYTGHLYKGRGVDVILRIAAAMPSVTFHIVGGTAKDVQDWQPKAENLQNVIFHGHVTHAEIPHYLQGFDILLAPYQKNIAVAGNKGDTARWCSPLKIFEYMSAGKPMIVSDLPVLREVLNDQNAILCDPENPQDWIAAIEDVRKNPERAAKKAASAMQDFLNHYTWARRAQKIAGETRK